MGSLERVRSIIDDPSVILVRGSAYQTSSDVPIDAYLIVLDDFDSLVAQCWDLPGYSRETCRSGPLFRYEDSDKRIDVLFTSAEVYAKEIERSFPFLGYFLTYNRSDVLYDVNTIEFTDDYGEDWEC